MLSIGLLFSACATIPDGRYGVDEVNIVGMEDLDRFALQACLATQERAWLAIDLSKDPAPTCGKPPFDARRLHLPLFRWAWTDWPLYEPSVFERDLARVERWYRARGYYGARILETTSDTRRGAVRHPHRQGQIRAASERARRRAGARLQRLAARHGRTRRQLSEELMAVADEIAVDDRFDEADLRPDRAQARAPAARRRLRVRRSRRARRHRPQARTPR